nr:unnamed protein product [Digitaria exilis]
MGAKENGQERDDHSANLDRDGKQGKEAESDYEPGRDSLSSQGEATSNEDTKAKRVSRVPKKLAKKESKENSPRSARSISSRQIHTKLQYISSNSPQNKSPKTNKVANGARTAVEVKKTQIVKVPSCSSSEVSEEADEKAIEDSPTDDKAVEGKAKDDKAVEAVEDKTKDDKSVEGEATDEVVESRVKDGKAIDGTKDDKAIQDGTIDDKAIEAGMVGDKDVEGGTKDGEATEGKKTDDNAVEGGTKDGEATEGKKTDDNAVEGRETDGKAIEEAKEIDVLDEAPKCDQSTTTDDEIADTEENIVDNGNAVSYEKNEELDSKFGKLEQELREVAALEAMTPNMQTPMGDLSTPKIDKLLGPSLGDQQHGNFSIDLWKTAFRDAFSRICPLRAGGHECGCLPVLAKLVMEQCVARLDVAMFNAILRESANEIPSDPVSDPIVDSRVLPIPAGDLSFGSGAQLKNSVGNWSRWLTDMFGMNGAESGKDGQDAEDNVDERRHAAESNCFKLLNELSDLLMLPKDMLLEKSIRKEVCPSIGLPVVTRILCNFTPDEFCPDPVPGMVLEELSSEGLMERFTEKDMISTFPASAAPVVYCPPSLEDVEEKVADTGCRNPELDRRGSMVQRRGYTSDDDLDDLDSPLASLYDKSAPPSPCSNGIAHFSTSQGAASMANVRYELLREVWSERR